MQCQSLYNAENAGMLQWAFQKPHVNASVGQAVAIM